MSGMLSSVLIRKMTPTLLPQDLKIYMNVYCIMMLMLCQLLAAKRGQQSVFFQYIKAHLTPMVHLKIPCIWEGLHHYSRGQTDLSQPMKISGKWNWWIHEVFYPRVYFISIPFFFLLLTNNIVASAEVSMTSPPTHLPIFYYRWLIFAET